MTELASTVTSSRAVELLDVASELFQLLQARQQKQSEASTGTAPATACLSLADQLENALQSAASQFPQHLELLRALLSPSTGGSDAPSALFPTVTTASDVQEALAQLVLGGDIPT